MKSRTLLSRIAIVVLAALIVPSVLAAQDASAQAEESATMTKPNPIPLMNDPLVPDAIRPGSAGFTLTINGTGFVSSSVVRWNGSARATTFVSKSQLKAAILTSDVSNAGTASVTVQNPSPGGGTSKVAFFEVTIPASTIALAKSDYSAATGFFSVATADFNQDGKLDLAVANSFSNAVSVLLGNGDGTFRGPVDYGTFAPVSVRVGDFNGDGKPDLVAVNPTYPGIVSILLGRGDGTFAPEMDYQTGNFPVWVAVGDFNGDGKLDLAVANFNDDTVSVLLGNGDGTFRPKMDYPTGNGPDWVAVGDFNGDGKLDLAVANFNEATVSVLLGNGDGTFQPQKDYATGRGPGGGAVGDFNADGKLDLAVPNSGDNTVSVLLGNGDGTFGRKMDYGTGSGPAALSAADLNGDNKLDLVVANNSGDTVSVLFGNGDGTFQTHSDYATGHLPTEVAVGDFNRDGRLDLGVSNSEGAVSVLLQTASVTLSPRSLNFGNQLLGTMSPAQKVTVTNTAGLPTIVRIAISGTNMADFRQTDNCGSKLAPGAHCTILVILAPTQTGPLSASVMITDNAPGSPQTAGLSGTGIASGPNATLSPSALSFATQIINTSSPAKSISLTNYGETTLDITSIAVTGDFNDSNNCGSTLTTLMSCTITVVFMPSHSGTRLGTLSITDNVNGSPQRVALTGVGTVVELVPGNLSFGTVRLGTSSTLTSVMTNLGKTSLHITGVSASGTYFSQTNTCGSTLGPHKSCNINVIFAPGSTGTFSGAVSISDDGGGSPQHGGLSGTGEAHCGGPCRLGCPAGCRCARLYGICFPVSSDLMNELLRDWSPILESCGAD